MVEDSLCYFDCDCYSLAAWVIQNYGKANRALIIGGAAAVLLILTIIIRINSVAYRKIDKLEDL